MQLAVSSDDLVLIHSHSLGSYICSFDGSSDLQAIDLNTAIHVYVYDEVHLLTHSGFDFQQSVQFQTATIPCTPTHPDVKIQLEREGRSVVVDNKFQCEPLLNFDTFAKRSINT